MGRERDYCCLLLLDQKSIGKGRAESLLVRCPVSMQRRRRTFLLQKRARESGVRGGEPDQQAGESVLWGGFGSTRWEDKKPSLHRHGVMGGIIWLGKMADGRRYRGEGEKQDLLILSGCWGVVLCLVRLVGRFSQEHADTLA